MEGQQTIIKEVSNARIGKEIMKRHNKNQISEEYAVMPEIVFSTSSMIILRKCTHKQSNQVRIVKSFDLFSILDDEQRDIYKEELVEEIEVQMSLDHPNIIRVYEYFVTRSQVHVIMEYCEGGDLFERFQTVESLSEKDSCLVLHQILSAIAYCNELGYYHLQLSPESILFDNKDSYTGLKVINFGRKPLTEQSDEILLQVLSFPYYIPPECTFFRYYETSDVWSCGVVLYLLLAEFIPPFNHETSEEILSKVRIGSYTMEGPQLGAVSDQAKRLLAKMLEYDPGKRLTAKRALADLWFEDTLQKDLNSQNIVSSNSENLKSLNQKSKLQKMIFYFIGSNLTSQKERVHLANLFKSLDSDNSGTLSKSEIKEGLLKTSSSSLSPEEIEQIFNSVDTDNSGVIQYSEFIAAVIEIQKSYISQKIKACFKQIDTVGIVYY